MASDRDFGHFDCDRVLAVSSQSIDTGAHDKMGAQLLRGTKEFVYVIFAITNMDETISATQQRSGTAHILEPAHAFFGLDRHPGLVDLALERQQPFELVPCPETYGR